MELRGLKLGDRVEVNVRGRVFAATFQGSESGRVRIEPESPRFNYFSVKKTEIVKRLKGDS